MNTTKKVAKVAADGNTRVRAEHAKLRGEILKLAPHFDQAKLEAVTKTYGSPNDMGLNDIVIALRTVARFNERFAVSK